MTQPLIAISPNRFQPEQRQFYQGKELEYGEASMAQALRLAGAVPVMAYRAGSEGEEMRSYAAEVMSRCAGLLLSGGADMSPTSYGEEAREAAWRGDSVRDGWETALFEAAESLRVPILGVCRGHQLINVARGGSLVQDLQSMVRGTLAHRSQELYCGLRHALTLVGASRMSACFDGEPLQVNSVHHQAVKKLGQGLRVTAHSPDGTIEGIEDTGEAWIVGVQWHPEWMLDSLAQRRLFEVFVAQASESRR